MKGPWTLLPSSSKAPIAKKADQNHDFNYNVVFNSNAQLNLAKRFMFIEHVEQ